MSYTKQNFEDGKILTADQLNNMEAGIVANETLIGEKLNASELTTAIDTALTQAKESGEFKGEPGEKGDKGDPGENGTDGYTPVKGVDYFTAEDIAEVAEQASGKVSIDDSLSVSGFAADAKAVGDALAGKQPVGEYLTEETDPTVPEWAKQPEKPTYTADEVGALSGTDTTLAVSGKAADAAVTGEALATKADIGYVNSGLSGKAPAAEFRGSFGSYDSLNQLVEDEVNAMGTYAVKQFLVRCEFDSIGGGGGLLTISTCVSDDGFPTFTATVEDNYSGRRLRLRGCYDSDAWSYDSWEHDYGWNCEDHYLGTLYDLPTRGHTSASNPYTFPSDGYIYYYGTSSSNVTGYLLQGENWLAFTAGSAKQILFVKKGMTAYSPGGANKRFAYYPIV